MRDTNQHINDLIDAETENRSNPKIIRRDTIFKKIVHEFKCFGLYVAENLFQTGKKSYINFDTLEVKREPHPYTRVVFYRDKSAILKHTT